jgi:SAM-dependent methyltransferase
LADRICPTVAGNLEEAFVGEKFDVIFGNVVLHHLDLTGLGERLRQRLRAGGRCVFREPVIRCGLLAAPRSLVPWYPSNPSPDERPLTDRDLRALAQPFEACEIFYYEILSRLRSIVRSPALISALHRADAILLACPPLRHLASSAVFRLSTQPPADVGDRRSRR